MLTFEEIQHLVSEKFEQLNWSQPPTHLYEPVGYVLSLGGKRLRPALLLMAANIFSDEVTQFLSPAVGVEVFHNFTLLHDDIMDHAPLRRGKPTVHEKWNENVAILSGDAMLIKAYQYFAQMPEDKLSELQAVFSKTALEVCEGQQYDMDFETQAAVSEADYLEMIRLKTAVLLAASLKIGARLGGATKEQADNLYSFGIHIGMAFQLKDDLLDVYGNSATFGKQTGGDILCNKKTYLLINALRLATDSQQKELESWLNKETYVPEEKVAAVTALFDKIGVKTLCEKKMDKYLQAALHDLEKVSVSTTRTAPLSLLATQLMDRTV